MSGERGDGEVGVEEALSRVRSLLPGTTMIVDLDTALVRRSSADGFLEQVTPVSVVASVLALLDVLAPWRFVPGTRDRWRLTLAAVLTPWTALRWRRTARGWARRCVNADLCRTISRHEGPVVVTTCGFRWIARPVVTALLPGAALHTSPARLDSVTVDGIDAEQPATAAVVTGSASHEKPLGSAVTVVLAPWPRLETPPSLSRAYVPLQYTERAKRPGSRFVFKGLLTDDLVALLLAYSWISDRPVVHGLGLTLIAIAGWIIYEVGYVENDVQGARREDAPVLSAGFEEYRDTVPLFAPWVWALCLTIPGAWFLVVGGTGRDVGWIGTVGLWLGVLAVSRLVFAVFNRLPRRRRLLPHAGLQIGKYAGPAVVTATSVVGVAVIVAQTMYRWVPYLVYRLREPADYPVRFAGTLRVVVFGACVACAGVVVDGIDVTQALVVFGWFAVRARREYAPLLRACRSK